MSFPPERDQTVNAIEHESRGRPPCLPWFPDLNPAYHFLSRSPTPATYRSTRFSEINSLLLPWVTTPARYSRTTSVCNFGRI